MRVFPQNSAWLQSRKCLVTRVALFVIACVLIVTAVLMLNSINDQSNRNQQLTNQMTQSNARVEVLVLASYDDADAATTLQRDGVIDLLDRSSVAADVEYLDAHTTVQNANLSTTADYGSALANSSWGQALAKKIADHGPYSAVICIDDDALCFIEATHSTLFANTPVIFLGVNDASHAEQIFQAGYATGLLEAYDTRATMETAKTMVPDATSMMVITDDTATGKGDRAAFEQVVTENPDLFSGYDIYYTNASEVSRAALGETLANAGSDTMVVYLDGTTDAAGNYYDAAQTAYFLSQASAQPIFAMRLTGAGEGFAGSGFIDYEGEGLRAGEIVVDVLNGTRPADIAVETYTSSGTVFDVQVLGDYGISLGLVPNNATLVNQSGLSLEALRSVTLPILLLILGIGCIACFVYLGYRRTVLQMEDIVTQRNALERRFYTDNLTEMPNMQWLTAYAGSEASTHVRSIVGVELIEAGQLDETCGAGTSDEIVKVMADRLNGLEKTFLVRPAYNQFIIGYDHPLKSGGKSLEEVVYLLNQPVFVEGDPLTVSTCVGVFNRERGMSIEEMVAGIELAIRQAEEAGNTDDVIFYDHGMRVAEENKQAITSTLRSAINKDDLHVLYQPQIELATSKVVGYEALVRLRGEPYPPDEFIPIAEASDQIIEIDRIVTRKVAQQLATWKKRKQRMIPVSINHSFGQLRDEQYVARAKEVLEENRISTRFLRIEIKENLFLNNMAKATSFIDELREQGFGVTIDGFGAGYTSLGHVMQVPADVVKLDRSLTESFLQGGDASVIENLVRLLHGDKKRVVIEGVETAEQLQMCVDVGCDIVQGFYLSEPLLPEKALQYKPPMIDYPDRPDPLLDPDEQDDEPAELVDADEAAPAAAASATASDDLAAAPAPTVAAAPDDVANTTQTEPEPAAAASATASTHDTGESLSRAADATNSQPAAPSSSVATEPVAAAPATAAPTSASDDAPAAPATAPSSDTAPTTASTPTNAPASDIAGEPLSRAADAADPQPAAPASATAPNPATPTTAAPATAAASATNSVARKSVTARVSAATSGVIAKVSSRNASNTNAASAPSTPDSGETDSASEPNA